MDELIAAASQLVLETARARDVDYMASPHKYTRAQSFGRWVPKANRNPIPGPYANQEPLRRTIKPLFGSQTKPQIKAIQSAPKTYESLESFTVPNRCALGLLCSVASGPGRYGLPGSKQHLRGLGSRNYLLDFE
jgi:hypothetical protein